jgi:hypothetical protein
MGWLRRHDEYSRSSRQADDFGRRDASQCVTAREEG